jgi:hypothetical protein
MVAVFVPKVVFIVFIMVHTSKYPGSNLQVIGAPPREAGEEDLKQAVTATARSTRHANRLLGDQLNSTGLLYYGRRSESGLWRSRWLACAVKGNESEDDFGKMLEPIKAEQSSQKS